MLKRFEDLGVISPLCSILSKLQINKPTPIQEEAIPIVLNGKSLVGVSNTGTGKTLCYVLPIIQKLSFDAFGAYALILVPTREIARQVADQLQIFGDIISLRLCLCIGGTDFLELSLALDASPHVIVATPGRLAGILRNEAEEVSGLENSAEIGLMLDESTRLLSNGMPLQGVKLFHQRLQNLKMLIFDEADLLLQKTFEDDLRVVLGCLSGCSPSYKDRRQTLLFSATLSHEVLKVRDFFNKSAKEGNAPVQESSGAQDEFVNRKASSTQKGNKTIELCYGHSASRAEDITVENSSHVCFKDKIFEERSRSSLKNLSSSSSLNEMYLIDLRTSKSSGLCGKSGSDICASSCYVAGIPPIGTESEVNILPEKLTQYYIFKPSAVHNSYLFYLLRYHFKSTERGIIFTASCYACQLVNTMLEIMGEDVTCLHSMQNQRRRNVSLLKFRNQKVRILVATDVACRGLDLPKVAFVICYHFPRDPTVYVHRVGRTARAGKGGLAISLLEENDVRHVLEVEDYTGEKLVELGLDEDEVLKSLMQVSLATQKAFVFLSEIGFDFVVKEKRKERYKNKKKTKKCK